MFDIKKDIQAMTTFRRNPAKFLKHPAREALETLRRARAIPR